METIRKDLELNEVIDFVEDKLKKRKGFTKGGMPTLEVKNLAIEFIDTSKNIRTFDESEDSLFELKTSLSNSGQNYPVLTYIFNDEIVCAAGHRRIAAAKKLGWKTIWALIIQIPNSTNESEYIEKIKQLAFEDNHSSEEMDFYDVCKNLYLDACRRKLLNRSRGVTTHTKGVIEQLRESQYRKYSVRQLQRMVKIGSWPKISIDILKGGKGIRKKTINDLTDSKIIDEKNVHAVLLVLTGEKDLETIGDDNLYEFVEGLLPKKRQGAISGESLEFETQSSEDIQEEKIALAKEVWEQNFREGITDFSDLKKILKMSAFID